MKEKIAMGGSRIITKQEKQQIHEVVKVLLEKNMQICVGCAIGADQAIIESVMSMGMEKSLKIFAAFGIDGKGGWEGSAINTVIKAFGKGASVEWYDEKQLNISLKARLAIRTKNYISEANKGMIVFLSSEKSKGSIGAIKIALRKELKTIVFCNGFEIKKINDFSEGWGKIDKSGVWKNAFRFEQQQKLL